MKSALVFFLIICFLAIGSGTAEHLHDLAHDAEDASADVAARRAGKTPVEHPEHDESNCPVHFALHAPALTGAMTVPLLILLGLLIAFITELPRRIERQLAVVRFGCRGPPLAV